MFYFRFSLHFQRLLMLKFMQTIAKKREHVNCANGHGDGDDDG